VKLCLPIVAITLLSSICSADTLYLKSGISIRADSVVEAGDTVSYTVGATKYSMPKSAIAKIEHDSARLGVTVTTPRAGTFVGAPQGPAANPKAAGTLSDRHKSGRQKLATAVPADSSDDSQLAEILNLGQIDEQALDRIEHAGDAAKTASAYLVACGYEMQHARFDSAKRYADRAAQFAPDTVWLHTYYAALSTVQQSYADALAHAQRASVLSPKSVFVLGLLGKCYYNADDLQNAVATWKQALALHDDDYLRALIARVQRQMDAEADYSEQASSHFSLRYEGREIGPGLKADLLHNLEQAYAELSRDLQFTPPADIAVVLYSEKVYFDVTQAPKWSGAVYDGKLRIPIAGVTEVTPEIRSTLKHELTHSFIHAMTHDNCPAWLNEGIAQLMEPRSSVPYRRGLARMFREGKQAPLQALEAPFARFDAEQATIAYLESLLTVEYLKAEYGSRALTQMLESLGAGSRVEEALQTVTHHSYHDIERSVGEFAGMAPAAGGS
jgi:tetratricopeptide (TPR) repeat protein